MIITLRGTNGSGKTHLVKSLIERYGVEREVHEEGKVVGTILPLPGGKILGLVGKYATACGGADTIQPYSRIAGIIDRLDDEEGCTHVLAEGSLVSSSHGSLGRHIDAKYGDRCVYVFLGTTLEQCVINVKNRRAERGDERPFDDFHLVHKYNSVHLSVLNIRDRLRRKIVVLEPNKALPQMIRLLHNGYDPATCNKNGLQPLSRERQGYLRSRTRERKGRRRVQGDKPE